MGGALAAASLARRGVAALAAAMARAGGWGFLALSALIAFDVLGRRFLGVSTGATTEIGGYALASGLSWGLAHALARRTHVRIEVLVDRLPPRARRPLHLLALAALAAFAAVLAWSAWGLVEESHLFGATDISALRIPLVVPQGLWALGIGVFLVLALLMLAENALLLLAGRGEAVERNLRARSDAEEAEEALEAIGAGPGRAAPP